MILKIAITAIIIAVISAGIVEWIDDCNGSRVLMMLFMLITFACVGSLPVLLIIGIWV